MLNEAPDPSSGGQLPHVPLENVLNWNTDPETLLQFGRLWQRTHTYASRDTDDRVEGVEQHRKALAELGVLTRLSAANPQPLSLYRYVGAMERAKGAKEAK